MSKEMDALIKEFTDLNETIAERDATIKTLTDALKVAEDALEAYLMAGHKEARREASVVAKAALETIRTARKD